ncbi:MAG: RNA-binding protein [Acidobacteriota bacterium]
MKKLFVGGLSWGTNDQALMKAFEKFGPVTEAKVITERETGRSRGFGFVTYENDADAEKAKSMDGQELDGRKLRVNDANQRESRGGGGGGGGRDRGRFRHE